MGRAVEARASAQQVAAAATVGAEGAEVWMAMVAGQSMMVAQAGTWAEAASLYLAVFKGRAGEPCGVAGRRSGIA